MHVKHYILLSLLFTCAGCNQGLLQPAGEYEDLAVIQTRADAAYQNEDWKAAEADYSNLTKKLPGDAELWFRLGNVYARTGQYDAAVAAYREALVRDTKNSKVWHNLGIIQLRQAANTFIEMVQYTEESDPLNQRARYIINSMTNLMETNFEPDNRQLIRDAK
jgi:Cytochrome c biogenesis factor